MENAVTSLDFSTLTSQLSSAITPELILGVMGAIVAAVVTPYLITWGGRKIVNGFQSVLHGGKIRV